MLDQLLREIVGITVGKGNEAIADLLHSKKHVNEFNIAKKLGITINQTRNILYKISDYGLVSSERKKDKKKGWYTYYWRFEIAKCLDFLKKRLLESRERFQTQIDRRENKQYYICEYCNLEHSEDEALLMEFACDECGELFTTKDNSTLVKGLKKNLEKIDEKISEIDIEIEKEQKKIDKRRMASVKAEEVEKEKKKEEAKKRREEKRKERQRLKEIEAEKSGKVAKKKTVKKVAKKKTPTKKKVSKKKEVSKKPIMKKVTKKKVAKKTPSGVKTIKKLVKKISSSSKKKVVKKRR